MSKKRVHELAKELGMENREAVLALQAAGIAVKTHSSSVYEEEALAVLNKVKTPEPSAAPRRPGMVIVKKRRDVEGEPEAQAQAPVAESAPVSASTHEPESAAQAPEAAAPMAPPATQEPQVQAQAPMAAAQADAPTPPEAAQSHAHVEQPSAAPTPAADAGHPAAPVAPAVEAAAPKAPEAEATPAAPEQAATQGAGQSADPAPAAAAPPARAPDAKPMPTPRQEVTMSRRQDGGYIRPPDAPPVPGAPGEEATRPGGRRVGVPGTSATVVRMIDRDKLLERVPGRRLGGAPAGPGAPRYGQVTELKVVTDPFGRGREMVAVGANKRKGPAGPVPGAGRGAPGGVAARKGRGGKRDMADMRERAQYPSRLKRKKTGSRSAKKTEVTQPKASKRIIRMKETIVVADLAHQLGAKAVDLVRKLMGMGSMVTQNQAIDFDTAQLLAAEFDHTVESVAFAEDEVIAIGVADDADTAVISRPPVVTVMGHVDHGKTSLLDAIRKARVASGEAGGITQHIGAYSVPVPGKGTVTFLDTPGHAAFTSMRARGAQVTDLVVLVVAADDGVMPQTEEAIRHAQAAKVPIIVAVNKIDRPDANADRVMQELTKFELLPEAWGGETLYVNTSATQGTGIDELLETILLQAEVLELRANPNRPAIGVVVEAQLDRGRGPVATVLVQQGTLKRGDAIVVGCASGKIRAMMDDTGKQLDTAGPSTAVEITGLDLVPDAGDTLNVVESAESAREIASHRTGQKRTQEQAGPGAMSLDDLMKRMQGQSGLELKLVLKADVQGSVEAVRGALSKLSTDEVTVNVIYGGVGAISESDIMLAAASGGLVLGFGVRPDSKARMVSDREGVEVRTYSIIYEAIDDVRLAMEGLLTPESREKILGRAEVRDLFKVSKVGTIGGCRVVEGKASRSARVRVLRDSVQIYEGKTSSLRHFKNDVREVDTGLECGIGVEGYNDLKAGDVLEFFAIEEVARTLSPSTTPGARRGGSAPYEARP